MSKASSGDSAKEIVEALRASPAAYQAAAAKEGDVWGRTFSDADAKAVWEEDRIAASQLRPGRGLGLARVFRERNLTFRSGLSLDAFSRELGVSSLRTDHPVDAKLAALRTAQLKQ